MTIEKNDNLKMYLPKKIVIFQLAMLVLREAKPTCLRGYVFKTKNPTQPTGSRGKRPHRGRPGKVSNDGPGGFGGIIEIKVPLWNMDIITWGLLTPINGRMYK